MTTVHHDSNNFTGCSLLSECEAKSWEATTWICIRTLNECHADTVSIQSPIGYSIPSSVGHSGRSAGHFSYSSVSCNQSTLTSSEVTRCINLPPSLRTKEEEKTRENEGEEMLETHSSHFCTRCHFPFVFRRIKIMVNQYNRNLRADRWLPYPDTSQLINTNVIRKDEIWKSMLS